MIVNRSKEKAFNAIAFFLTRTGSCFKKKTYKLLWLLDSEHFQSIGRSVTGYQYFAWKMGPVPTELHEAIDTEDPELLEYFDIEEEQVGPHTAIALKNKQPFDSKLFSKRELAIMESLANRFDLATGEEMERFTHRVGTPWYRVWTIEHRPQGEIPYEYALSELAPEDQEIVLDLAQERQAFLTNYK